MATLQQITDKRKELMQTGQYANEKDAMVAARQQLTSTTPVQNPPAVPPQQTTPPQTIAGVNGEQFKVAPVNQQTGLSQPVQTPTATQPVAPVQPTTPAPIKTEVKPTQPTKTEAPIDYNVSAGREQEIQKNVADITQTNPNLLKDRNAYNQAFGYATADAGKKALLDSAFQGANQPMNQKDVLNAFISGVNVPEQNTQAYRNAKVQYDTFKKFNAMTPTQLLDNLKQGQIGSEMDSLLSQNPGYVEAKAKLSQAQRTASLNRMGQSALGVINGKEPEDLSDLSKVEAKYNAPPGTNVAAYEQYVTNNEDVKTAGTALHNIASQISDVTKTYNEALKSLKAQYGDMPASALITLMSTRTQDTKSLLDSLIDAKTLAQGDFDLAMKMAEGSYGAYTKDLEQQQKIATEQRQIQNTLALSQAQYDQQVKQQAQALNDPTMAITSMVDEYKKLGIPFTRSTQQIIQDFQSSGQDLPTYLTDLQKTIQSKPEYEALQAKQSGTEWQSTNITRYNPSTGANESTPIFYRKKTSGGFEAVDLSGNPIDVSALSGTGISTPSTGSYATSTNEMRTDRNMNPTAMTTDVARTMGLVEGVDYVKGDPFTTASGGTLYTAKMLGDPIETTIRAIDKGGFTTKSGANRWTYTASMGLTNEKWNNMTYDQKAETIKQMYKHEGGNGKAIGETSATSTIKTYSPDEIKSFEAFDGKSFPSDYKTPAQQEEFRNKYNEWRLNQVTNPIRTGEDILKIQLSDKATEQEKNAIQYGSRMLNAINDLIPLESAYAKLPLKDQIYQEYAPSLLKSDNQKTLDSRKKDFITAVLRKESGASISPSEFANEEKKYFAQPGDSEQVIAAKQNARNFAIKAILSAAGRDISGKMVSSLYNPESISTKTDKSNDITSRIKSIREKANQK